MPAKKPAKAKEVKQGVSWKTVTAILVSISAFVGAIVSGLDFIQYLRAGYQDFLWLGIAVVVVIWFIVLWLLFKQKNIYWILWFAVTLVAGVAIWGAWTSYKQEQDKKIIVLVARFDGPEDKYHLRDEILKQLKAVASDYEDTEVIPLGEIITEAQGSAYARRVAGKMHADLVVWGWYTETDTSNLNIYVENLSYTSITAIPKHNAYHQEVGIADFNFLTIQKQLGSDLSDLISLLVGVIRYQSGDYVTALKLMEPAGTSDAAFVDVPALLLIKGNSHIMLDQDKAALTTFSQMIALRPDSFEGYANRGIAHAELGNYEDALHDYLQAIQINPNYAPVHVNLGILYVIRSEFDRALASFDSAIEVDPRLAAAYYNRGNAYWDLGQLDQAIRDATQAIHLKPAFTDAFVLRGTSYSRQDRQNLAIADYNEAIRLQPDYARAYYNRGFSYELRGEYNKALEDYSQAIRLDPGYAEAYINRIWVNRELGRYDPAFADYAQLISLYPENSLYYYERGLAYGALKKFDLAVNDFTTAIRLKPDDADYYNTRGAAYHELEQYDQAIVDFQKSLSVNPDFVTPHFNLGNTYDDLNQIEKAIDEYTLYIEMVLNIPDNNRSEFMSSLADAYYYRGIDYQKLGKNIEANADFAKYKELTGKDIP